MRIRRQHGAVPDSDGTTAFRLWAPRADAVVLLLDRDEVRMEPTEDGWWAARAEAGHGDRYRYSLDGGPPRPDPAARWLPEGVHGPAAVLDPRAWSWSPADRRFRAAPLQSAVLYELHVGTFTADGTLAAAAAHLRPLADLGVTHVELLPVNAFNGTHGWGYDGVAWSAVHAPYGGPAALAAFVDACHRLGLAVVLDVVHNHLGPSGNYLPEFGPYLLEEVPTPWGQALNLDRPGSDVVRRFVLESALGWLVDFHVDALRLDAVHGLVDTSATHLLAELADETAAVSRRVGRPLQLIAETDRNDPQTVRARAVGGLGLDGQWADDLHHAIHTAVTGEAEGYYEDYTGLPDVAVAYTRGFVFDGSRRSPFRGRRVGAPLPADVASGQLVTCIQNHDQVGNRATGDRLTVLVEPDLVRVAITLLCAAPSTPMLFMGEEYGETNPFQYFTSHPEEQLGRAVREGRRREFAGFTGFAGEVPDPQDPATRDRCVLDRDRAGTPAGQARVALWRDLLALRRTEPALGNGRRDLVRVREADPDTLVVERRDPFGAPLLLVVNLTVHDREAFLPDGIWEVVLTTADRDYGGPGRAQDAWPARSASLYRGVTSG